MTIEIRELIIEARVTDDINDQPPAASLSPVTEADLVNRISRQVMSQVMAKIRDEAWRFR
ncbi:DUF5908 family protein [Candidatus Pantoea multigeneris]|uniref:Uncharacterized protein n=1 Tax=Candidatus Pantoea multigeneris TaxID=2608357 RepID=A0ABX0R8U1_9GAMM|nr:DUF5908 family protein [Pantoea multigeneris]NIF20553.1 hypothetical protein [Pantoea multigeneris]